MSDSTAAGRRKFRLRLGAYVDTDRWFHANRSEHWLHAPHAPADNASAAFAAHYQQLRHNCYPGSFICLMYDHHHQLRAPLRLEHRHADAAAAANAAEGEAPATTVAAGHTAATGSDSNDGGRGNGRGGVDAAVVVDDAASVDACDVFRLPAWTDPAQRATHELGHGAFKIAYKMFWPRLNRTVAVKTVRVDGEVKDAAQAELFVEWEAEYLRIVRHAG